MVLRKLIFKLPYYSNQLINNYLPVGSSVSYPSQVNHNLKNYFIIDMTIINQYYIVTQDVVIVPKLQILKPYVTSHSNLISKS